MPQSVQLLKQINRALALLASESDNAKHQAIVGHARVALNELVLREDPGFYLSHIRGGKALLAEGRSLMRALALAPAGSEPAWRDDLGTASGHAVLNAEIHALRHSLSEVLCALADECGQKSDAAPFLQRIVEWERSLYIHRLQSALPRVQVEPRTITSSTLQSYLRERFPERKNLRVTRFTPVDGGFSKNTILFDTHDDTRGAEAMALRAQQPVDLMCWAGNDVEREYHMICWMREAGLPVADPLWLELDREKLGTRFLVSRKVSGDNFGGNYGSNRPLSPKLLDSIIGTLIKVHGVRIDPANPFARASQLRDWLQWETVSDAVRYYFAEHLPQLMRDCEVEPSPQLLLALKWLRDNVPQSDEPPAILHGDFALNNLLIAENRVAAILDWESARLGDPADDIVWTQKNLSQYISMPEFLARYESETGRKLTPFRIAYAKVGKCALNSVTCLRALSAVDKYDDANINFCLLGLRYLGDFGSEFTQLIGEAEAVKQAGR